MAPRSTVGPNRPKPRTIANEARGLDYWLGKRFSENRSTTAFDPARYLAMDADLRAAFGTDQHAATLHWVQSGAAEGRTV